MSAPVPSVPVNRHVLAFIGEAKVAEALAWNLARLRGGTPGQWAAQAYRTINRQAGRRIDLED